MKENNYLPLFTLPDTFTQSALVALGDIIPHVLNQSALKKGGLKYNIRDLSALLTSERKELATPYWTNPRLTSAYVNFFMPWNLIRFTQLFPAMELPRVQDGDYILDLGSGPLTCIIALWISRPDYREKKLNIIPTDVVLKPMEIGLDILKALAQALDIPMNWNIQSQKKSFTQAIVDNARILPKKVKLLFSANILNEVETRQNLQNTTLSKIFSDYSFAIHKLITNDGGYIALEPGTRQGGRLVSLLRSESIKNSLFPHAPCPHADRCPLQANRENSSWCHMQCPAFAPTWLRRLSEDAGFKRDSLTLSFVYLRPYFEGNYDNAGRIVSNTFNVPKYSQCRYVCTDKGLALLVKGRDLPDSALVSISISKDKDQKTHHPIAYVKYDYSRKK